MSLLEPQRRSAWMMVAALASVLSLGACSESPIAVPVTEEVTVTTSPTPGNDEEQSSPSPTSVSESSTQAEPISRELFLDQFLTLSEVEEIFDTDDFEQTSTYFSDGPTKWTPQEDVRPSRCALLTGVGGDIKSSEDGEFRLSGYVVWESDYSLVLASNIFVSQSIVVPFGGQTSNEILDELIEASDECREYSFSSVGSSFVDLIKEIEVTPDGSQVRLSVTDDSSTYFAERTLKIVNGQLLWLEVAFPDEVTKKDRRQFDSLVEVATQKIEASAD